MTIKSTILGPGSLKLGETGSQREFAAQLTKCAIKTNTDTQDDVDTLSGETLEGEETYTYDITGTLLQDFELDSLEDYCFTNRGLKLPFEFTPNNTAARLFTGILKVRPLDRGGDVKKRNTSDFVFRIIGDYTPGEVDD